MNPRLPALESGLQVLPAHQLPVRTEAQRWLVTDLWLEHSVGLIGGEPKCYKSFLALDLAVAVASGTACLRRYSVPRPGPVLLYAAEDALHIVRQRLEGICVAAGCSLQRLDLQVITVPTLRLDLPADRERLTQTVEYLRPRLLILDPFVRLHRIDENASGEVAPLLAYLRELQRRYELAVLLVHHAKKGGGKIRAGQALRGSSEFHAWGDSNLYMRRAGNDLTMTVEHRAAPSMPPITLELVQREDALALQLRTSSKPEGPVPNPIDERIRQALEAAGRSLPLPELRKLCRVRNATLHDRLTTLTRTGHLLRDSQGYRLAPGA
ncbi:MAG: AAA family ATPase [Steroidobacteraceae bacterium]